VGSCYRIKIIQNKFYWWAFVHMVMNPWVFNGKFLEKLEDYELSRKILHHGVSYMSKH